MRNRTTGIMLRLTEKEKQYLKAQADNAGLKMEPFIRKLISGVEITPHPPENIAELLRELNAIGNNINQIARKVNVENKASQTQLEEIYRLWGEIYNKIKR